MVGHKRAVRSAVFPVRSKAAGLCDHTRFPGHSDPADPIGSAVIEDFDWARFAHAYGTATDTPEHLRALTSPNESARWDAVHHLDVAVLHQGFPESATAPAARVVAWLLTTQAVDAEIRNELVDFLGSVAAATAELRHNPYFAELIPALEGSVVEAWPVISAVLDSGDPALRMHAAVTAVEQLRILALGDQRPALVARLRCWADERSADRSECVRLLVGLDDNVCDFLSDPDPAVRIRAALAPRADSLSEATDIVVALLDRELPPWVRRSEVVRAIVARGDDFERIAKPAAAIAREADWAGSDTDWGPLLRFAFRQRYRPGRALSPGQQLFLQALVENDHLWSSRDGSVAVAFRDVGLPHNRALCKQIAAGRPPGR